MKFLLSYPRSGNHLVRFFIELLSELPTYGCKSTITDVFIHLNKFEEEIPFNISKYKEEDCYHKAHNISELNYNCDTLIFLIRNPREVLLRHNNNKINNKSYDLYFRLLNYYINFKGNKKIFYYEDIVLNKKYFIESLYNFLNLKNEKKKLYVLNNIDKLYNLSLNGKGRAWGGINSDSIDFYYKKIPHNIKNKFDLYLNNQLKKSEYQFIKDKYNL